MRLHHVQLAIPPGSEPACHKFYAGLLGWTELEKPEALRSRGGAWFATGMANCTWVSRQTFALHGKRIQPLP